MAFEKLLDRALKTNWTEEQISKFIGPYNGAYFTYSNDHLVRSNAASGGTVTALLMDMLTRIDKSALQAKKLFRREIIFELYLCKTLEAM